MTQPTLVRAILSRGLDDIIQLAEIVSLARFDIGGAKDSDLFAVVAGCLSILHGEGLAMIGDFDETGPMLRIAPWPGDSEAVVARAVATWKALGHDPNLAEVCWLELTALGRSVAQDEARP